MRPSAFGRDTLLTGAAAAALLVPAVAQACPYAADCACSGSPLMGYGTAFIGGLILGIGSIALKRPRSQGSPAGPPGP